MSLATALLVISPLAFLTGFALQRGQVCSVLAAKQIVETGRTSRLAAFLYAACWALVMALPLAWAMPALFKTSPAYQPGILTLAAGIAYGMGAFVTGACLFGICSRAVSGSLHFLAAVPGLAIGGGLASLLDVPLLLGPAQRSTLADPSPMGIAVLAIAVAVTAFAGSRMIKGHLRAGLGLRKVLTAARWRSSLALLVIGLTGGLLFATGEVWSYAGLMRQLGTMWLGTGAMPQPATIVGPIALFAGACVSLYLGGRFMLRMPTVMHTGRSFFGGIVMGGSATLIPGGNDVMVLYGLPGLAWHCVIAYAAMMTTLVALIAISRGGVGRMERL